MTPILFAIAIAFRPVQCDTLQWSYFKRTEKGVDMEMGWCVRWHVAVADTVLGVQWQVPVGIRLYDEDWKQLDKVNGRYQ
jgi:hypothetical protein